MLGLLGITFSLLLLVSIVAVVVVVAKGSAAILAVVSGILAIAMALPGFKGWVAKELPQLELIQCHRLPASAHKIGEHKITRNRVQRHLEEKANYLSFLEVNANGRLQDMFNDGSPFNNFSAEQLTNVAANGTKYPILFLDLGTPSEVPEISSPGPIVVYKNSSSSNWSQSNSLRTIRSATAVVFCNENFKSEGWTVDSPLVVVSDQNALQASSQIVNSQTSDGTIKLVKFELLKTAAKDAVVRMLKGQPMFPNMTDEHPTDEQAAQLRAAMLGDLKITTITPPPPTPGPVLASPAASSASGSTADGASAPETWAQQPEDVVVSASPLSLIDNGQPPLAPDTHLGKLVWERSNCGLAGFLYINCVLKLERRDLQFVVDKAFAKKEGVIKKQKTYLNVVDMEFAVSNPRIFFRNGHVGIIVDIEATNLSTIGPEQPNTLGAALKPNEQSVGMADKLMDVVRVTKATLNAKANAKRSLVASVPKHVTIRNAAVTVGQILYDKSTNHLFLADAHIQDFELTIGQRQANIASFKPFIKSTVDEFLKPHFAQHPIYDLNKIKYGWVVPMGLVGTTVEESNIRINMSGGLHIW